MNMRWCTGRHAAGINGFEVCGDSQRVEDSGAAADGAREDVDALSD